LAVPQRQCFTHSEGVILPIKKTFTYSEKSEEEREKYQTRLKRFPYCKRVYIDESGINRDLQREYARAPRGTKVEDTKRGRKYHRLNVIGALYQGNIIADTCYSHSMTAVYFEKWFEHILLACIPAGTTTIMDNASFHRKKALRKIARTHKVHILFLPAYSPDYNPIEKEWANMKRGLVDIIPHYKILEHAVSRYFIVRNTKIK
jgi:transposase